MSGVRIKAQRRLGKRTVRLAISHTEHVDRVGWIRDYHLTRVLLSVWRLLYSNLGKDAVEVDLASCSPNCTS